MSKKNVIMMAAILVGILAFVWFANSDESAAVQENSNTQLSQATAVEVTQPSTESVANYLNYLGTIEGERDGSLSFRIPGTLDAIDVEEGEKVQAGQRLATLSIPEMDAQLKRAKSEYKKAKSSMEFWKKEVKTDRTLYEEGAIAKTVLNKTIFNYEQALRSYQSARAAVEEVKERKKMGSLIAPADGRIGSIMIREGSNVGPNQPVFFFHQGEPVVRVDMLEQDIQKGIKVGSSVLADLNNGEILEGKVERVDFQAKPPFRSVRVYATFPDGSMTGRPPGAAISLRFEINKQTEAVVVPISAVDLRGGGPRLLRVSDDMKVEAVQVELGMQIGETRQVLGNISSSDKIISSGINNVEPGDPVEIVRELFLKSN